jgi:hypothetical protein
LGYIQKISWSLKDFWKILALLCLIPVLSFTLLTCLWNVNAMVVTYLEGGNVHVNGLLTQHQNHQCNDSIYFFRPTALCRQVRMISFISNSIRFLFNIKISSIYSPTQGLCSNFLFVKDKQYYRLFARA